MLTVAATLKLLFWHPSYQNVPFPSDVVLKDLPAQITDIAGMTGKERRALLAEAGVNSKLVLPFLRAMQHLTALHGRETVEDPMYPCHRLRSPQHWSPAGEMYYTPLLGHAMSLSDETGSCSVPVNAAVSSSGIAGPAAAQVLNGVLKGSASNASLTQNGPSYVGLLNQGSTCYLNSLLQALYHLSRFRSVIYNIATQEETPQAPSSQANGGGGASKSIPLALQRLFCRLQQAAGPVPTTELTGSFGWSDADSFIQHDIHELTRILLDNLEAKLEKASNTAGTPPKGGEQQHLNGATAKPGNAIRDMFQGVQQNYIKVSEENYCGTRDEQFYDIQLVVKGNRNIYESFDAIIAPEILDGKNKYCLEREGKKSYHRAEKGVLFERFPPVLLLHLARFDFDYEKGEMAKVLSRWDYYDRIDLSKYVAQSERDAPHPPGYFTYRLHSVLVHSGSDARFGHYYCFVNTRRTEDATDGVSIDPTEASNVVEGGTQWFKFNDETVSKASLKDVFGANFGGYKLNYWGAEVPHTASGYLLIYLRESDIRQFMSPVPIDDVPPHVVDQLTGELEQESRLRHERAEAHLYGKIHFTSSEDLEDQPMLLVNQAPCLQFPAHRTLRALLTDEASSTFLPFARKQFAGDEHSDVVLFTVYTLDGEGTMNPTKRLGRRITPHSAVKDFCAENETFVSGSRQGCVFVAPLSGESSGLLATLNPDRLKKLNERNELHLTHHKFYDPFELKIKYVDSLLLPADEPVTSLEQYVMKSTLKRGFLSSKGKVPRLRVSLEENGPRFVEVTSHYGMYPRSGEIFVWQEVIEEPERQDQVLFKTLDEFLGFHRHRVPVEVRLLQHPTFPVLCNTELSTEMTYDQLQRFVASKLHSTVGAASLSANDSSNLDHSTSQELLPTATAAAAVVPAAIANLTLPKSHDCIRFSRHNPDTNYPYFMKNRKSNGTTLKILLTVSNHNRMNQIVYFEICPFPVSEIETSNSFQFEMWQHLGGGKYTTSQHWLLLPEPSKFSMEELFACVVESVKGKSTNAHDEKQQQLALLPPPITSKDIRIVDVWKSKIYNVYDLNVPITTRFEESAEYRIEVAPRPIAGYPKDQQILLHVAHFTRTLSGGAGGSTTSPNSGKVTTHSDPFSVFLLLSDTLKTVRERIWLQLGLTEQQMEDWKLSIVHCGRTADVTPDVPIGEQLMAFARSALTKPHDSSKNSYYEPPAEPTSPHRFTDPQVNGAAPKKDTSYLHTIGGGAGPLCIFQGNQRDGTYIAYLGLEHAISLSAKRGVKAREERGGLRIHN
ncbi:ubiquitin hydrolase, putative [Bodo saltans]|uniref:ubiquitinyl hydrolase 1 n=1 Tax=Bodo saltans TaxID=75058 RepID=A0A0S4KFL3_BODSA|nr:ubiquitin hydrolase, putative [Bodo saltans]|eukprot:CUI14440.1 ubiquitin hydrolase, putative [Bodo saltans]